MAFFWIQCREQWAPGPEGVREKSKRWTPEGFHSLEQDKEGTSKTMRGLTRELAVHIHWAAPSLQDSSMRPRLISLRLYHFRQFT